MSNRCAYLHESYRTLRDGSLGWRCPRHFVPGYDQPVPPGQKPFAHRRTWDPQAEFESPFGARDQMSGASLSWTAGDADILAQAELRPTCAGNHRAMLKTSRFARGERCRPP
jgi:hypothetical protein